MGLIKGRHLAIFASSAILVGCAGGGGGSGAVPPGTPSVPVNPNPEAYKSFETSEYKAMGGHERVNAAYAYVDGVRGQGVKVAVVDSGIDASHPELSGRVTGGYDFINRSDAPTTDENGHGTHVAGIIGAAMNGSGVHGVAPEVTLVPYKIIDAHGYATLTDSLVAEVVAKGRADGVNIFSNSWGLPGDLRNSTDPAVRWPTMVSQIRAAASEGRVFVWAAGNEHAAMPSQLAALPDRVTDLKPDDVAKRAPWLTVTALDPDGVAGRGYANQCGYAASWCLSAPGTQITSLAPGGGLAVKTGTSMATPYVSGAIALLMSRFNTLDASQIAYRLLYTANKTGIYADSSIYGQGLMDLKAAYSPVGGLSLPTSGSVNGPVVGASEAGVFADARSAEVLRAALAGRQILMVDNFQRAPFKVDASELVRTRPVPVANPVREVSRSSSGVTRFALYDGPQVSRLGTAFSSNTKLGALSFSMSNGVDGSYSAPTKLAEHAPEIARFMVGGSMLGGVAETGMSVRYDLEGGTSLSSQYVTNASSNRTMVGLERSWNRFTLGVTGMLRSDQDSFVSLSSAGRSLSQAIQFTAGYPLADNVSLIGAFGQERKSVAESISDFGMSALQTKNMAVAGARMSLDQGRRMGVAFRLEQSPGAKYALNLPVSAEADGSVRYERVKLTGDSQVAKALAFSLEQDLRGGFMSLTLQAQPGNKAATFSLNRRY